MKISKLLFICILMMSIAMSLSGMNVAYAENAEYYYIPRNAEVNFYTKYSDDPYEKTLQIPSTYYAKKRTNKEGQYKTSDGQYYFVEYMGIEGYLKTSEFSIGAGEPTVYINISTPYFNNDIEDKLTCNIPNADIRKEPKLGSQSLATKQPNERLYFVGYINGVAIDPQNTLWYCVRYNDNPKDYGYIYAKHTNLASLNITEHPTSKTEDGVNGDGEDNKKEVVRNNLLETLLAIGIAIPAIVLIILVFKPRGDSKRNKKNRSAPPPPPSQRHSREADDYDEEPSYDDKNRRTPPPPPQQPRGRNRF